MHSLTELQQFVQKEIDSLQIKTVPNDLYEPIRYLLSLGGKRMRPTLVLLSCELFGGDVNKALKAAAGIELFHNFTLLHDDIMDNAPLRRNMPTVHEKWNTNVAILSGDAMYTLAIQQMMQVENNVARKVMELFTETALHVCEGQQFDMDYERFNMVKIPDYIHMIELKTAVLLACSLKTGAIIANTSSDNAGHIYEFGKNLGIAFQLQDDILDVFGDKNKFGKQTGGDIVANKKTFLLLKALECANIDQYDLLQDLIVNRHEKYAPFEKVHKVSQLYEELGVKELAQVEVNNYYNFSLQHLEKIEISSENKQLLYEFAEQLMKREL